MQQSLVFLITSTKLLQELMGELEDLHHLGITLRKGREDKHLGLVRDGDRTQLCKMSPCSHGEHALCSMHFETSWLLSPHLLIRDLQQIQHHFVGIHVLQQALLLLAHLLSNSAHLIQPL